MRKRLTLLLAMVMHFVFTYAQWSLTGNSILSTNFLGSTNAQPLLLKVNNLKSGLIDFNASNACTGFGYQTLLSNTGSQNTAVGYTALSANSTGSNNTAFGFQALNANTTGPNNSALGVWALLHNTSGEGNSAFGISTLWANLSGRYNTATGFGALGGNTTGNTNVASGLEALFNNTTGFSSVATGSYALFHNIDGSNLVAVGDSAMYNQNGGTGGNTAIGSKSLFSSTTGSSNTALGYQALFSNAIGGSNTAVGYAALKSSNTSSVDNRVENTAVGESALTATTTGLGNTALGTSALIGNTTGSFNIAIGDAAMITNITGSQNIMIGADADVSANNLSNATAIGFGSFANVSNKMVLGNFMLSTLTCAVPLTVTSDGRFKKNIQENVPGLEFINQLRPVTYTLDITGINKFMRPNPAVIKSVRSDATSAIESAATSQGEKVVHTGFVAQDVEAAAKKLNYTFDGVDAPKNSNDIYGLRYSEFVVPLVKATQQLSKQNDSLQQVVNNLQSQIDDIRNQLSSLKTGNSSLAAGDAAALKQNAPNPFNSNTIINYYLPAGAANAQIQITDMLGQNIQTIALSGRGSGQVVIAAGTLASGTYVYSLIVDGRKVVSRQMILTK